MSSEIAALIQLLDDDSANVLEAVTERLESLVPESLPALREAASSDNAKVRSRARELLRVMAIRGSIQQLIALAETADPDLEAMSFQLARIQDGALDLAALKAKLDRLADRARPVMESGLLGKARFEAFVKVIHRDLGFRGDTEDFKAYVNNFIHTVIDRRKGIPITLVLLYILVGRRIGLEIKAVGAPQRALAFHRADGWETYVDAYGGGRLLTYHECVERLKSRGVKNPDNIEYLRRLSSREVVERMIRNLVIFCNQTGRLQEGREFERLESALDKNRGLDRLA